MGFLPDRSKVVIRHILERNAQEFPERECAIFEDGERWTYWKALKEAYKAANYLSTLGIKRGENVLIFLPNGQNWFRAWWGVTSLGAIIVPVNTAYKGEMLKHVCLDSQASHMITTPDMAERLNNLELNLNVIDPAILSEGSSEQPKLNEPIEPWDIHAIVYTSGTTGPSKGVLLTYFRSYDDTKAMAADKPNANDTILVDLPLFHIAGNSMCYLALTLGARMVVRTFFSVSHYLDILRQYEVTIAIMVGSMQKFFDSTPPQPDDLNNPLRILIALPVVTADPVAFKKRFGIEELITSYGMTETGNATYTDDVITYPKTCGRPRPGVEVRLIDENDIPVPVGVLGEFIIRTDLPWTLNAGYWHRPEDTAHAWRNGWFHTGDIFYCDEKGCYYFVDRKKDALRRRGENISSFEVEREVMAYPDVLEVACVGVPGEFGEDEVKVFVVPREGAKFDPAELIKFLIPRMPYFMVPRFIEVVTELPKTATMRVKKFELRARGNSASTWDRESAGIVVTKYT